MLTGLRLAHPALLGLAVLFGTVAPLLVGCGAMDSGFPPAYPRVHYLTLYLNVSDQDGYALPDATIWIDGAAQPVKSAASFMTLTGPPAEWSGFQYNWRIDNYEVRIDDMYAREDVVVLVSKGGYQNQQTYFSIYEYDDEYIWGRATFVMEPGQASAAGAPVVSVRAPSERFPSEHGQPRRERAKNGE